MTVKPDSENQERSPASKANFLTAYSTVPGFQAWRDEELGSLFIRSIVKVFAENAHSTDIASMLTLVCSKVKELASRHCLSQVTKYENSLEKYFYFFPGHHSSQTQSAEAHPLVEDSGPMMFPMPVEHYEQGTVLEAESGARFLAMCRVNSQIWVLQNGCIRVYGRHLKKLLKTLTLPDTATRITYSGMRKCVIITHGGQKLTQCADTISDTDTNPHQLISEGSYVDTFCDPHTGILYALSLNNDNIEIHLFDWQESMYMHKASVRLANYQHSPHDHLVVHSGKLYISSYETNAIYVFDKDGTALFNIGKAGSGSPGTFSRPYLCSVSGSGDVLVADSGNNKLHFYNGLLQQWNIVSLEGNIQGPKQALIEDSIMWVLTQNKLLQFVKS